MAPAYSIVIPAYNESSRLGASLEKILSYIAAQGWAAEVIVVNDGSTDDTAGIVRQLAQDRLAQKNPKLRLIENPANCGKAYSVRNGILQARGGIIVFSDADLSSPVEELPKLLEALAQGADIAIGSRWVRPELQTQRQPLHRQFFGRVFNLGLRIVLGLKFKDTQCGFKAFQQRAAQKIFSLQKIDRWGFDPEILFLARKFGFRVQEVPVAWADCGGTRFRPLADGSRTFLEVLHIRWNDLTGKYDASAPSGTQPAKPVPGDSRPQT